MSLEGPELQLGHQEEKEEEEGGCTVCASHTLETAWPGHPMTPRCQLQKEARRARKQGGGRAAAGWHVLQYRTFDLVS